MMRARLKSEPGREDAIEIAIRKVGDDLDRYDLDSMAAKNAPPDDEGAEGEPMDGGDDDSMENCEACKDGTCTNPDHLSEEDMRALEMMGKE